MIMPTDKLSNVLIKIVVKMILYILEHILLMENN